MSTLTAKKETNVSKVTKPKKDSYLFSVKFFGTTKVFTSKAVAMKYMDSIRNSPIELYQMNCKTFTERKLI